MNWNRLTSGLFGQRAERRAERFLKHQGLVAVARNVHFREGEIDLVMREGDTLVFVEVKARQQSSHGGAIAAFDSTKRNRLLRAVARYLHQQGYNPAHMDYRLDLVAIQGDKIEWFKQV